MLGSSCGVKISEIVLSEALASGSHKDVPNTDVWTECGNEI